MKNSFKLLLMTILVARTMTVSAQGDPEGFITYSLPSTVISLTVEAIQENFHAGPYARYAEKYLGIKVRQSDESKYQLSSVKITPYVEADHTRRYTFNVKKGYVEADFLELSASGLVSFAGASYSEKPEWRFPVKEDADFIGKGVSSHLSSESTTLYRRDKKDAEAKVAVKQSVLVEKTPEKKAAEAARMILDLRDHRLKILTGDTDATYSGEALGAAIEELARLEQEYLSLFVGYSETQVQKKTFEVIPQPGDTQIYVAFRLSDNDGLVPADNLGGKPVIMELEPQTFENIEVTEEQIKNDKKVVLAYYRIPAICSVRIMDGAELLLQSRIPVYQLGQESSLPVNVKLK